MVILILIILLCFKLYIKNVNNTHLTIMLVIVFGLYETYYYKENFQSQTQPSSLVYDYNDDILQHKDKQECIYKNQKEITENYNLDSIKSVCYKINDLQECNRTTNCKYDNEINKCIDIRTNCLNDFKDISNIKCHYLDSEEKCNNLNVKLPDCHLKNPEDCNSSNECYFDYSENRCNFKKETCIGADKNKCKENKDCLYKYYSDVYSTTSNTNLKECHDFFIFFDINKHHIQRTIPNITIEQFDKLLDSEYKDTKFYGYRSDDGNKGTIYILNVNNLRSLLPQSKITLQQGLNKDKYIGNNNSMVIFEKKGSCVNNKKVCKWKNYSSFNCGIITNKDDCNSDSNPNCYFDNNKCNNKGFCYDKCSMNNTKSDCESKYSLKNEQLCSWDNINQKCINKDCLYNKEKC